MAEYSLVQNPLCTAALRCVVPRCCLVEARTCLTLSPRLPPRTVPSASICRPRRGGERGESTAATAVPALPGGRAAGRAAGSSGPSGAGPTALRMGPVPAMHSDRHGYQIGTASADRQRRRGRPVPGPARGPARSDRLYSAGPPKGPALDRAVKAMGRHAPPRRGREPVLLVLAGRGSIGSPPAHGAPVGPAHRYP